MEIWYSVGEEHHRLHELLSQSNGESEEAGDALSAFRRELLAHLHAEECGIYSILHSVAGFETPVAELREEDNKIRTLSRTLGSATPSERAYRLAEIKAALLEHIERHAHMLPVAQRRLPFHLAEHMKHAFESAKETALQELSSKEVEHADLESALADKELARSAAARASAHELDGRATMLLARCARREHAAASICQAAVDRLESPGHRSVAGEMAEAHLRRAHALDEVLAAVRPDLKTRNRAAGFSGRTKVFLAAFIGDQAILKTIRSLERRQEEFYRHMLQEKDVPGAARSMLDGFAAGDHHQLKNMETTIAADAAFHELHSRVPT